MRKNLLTAAFTVALLALCATTASARATWASYRNMWYKLDTVNNTAALWAVQNDTNIVNVPSTFKVGTVSYTITGIDGQALKRKGYANPVPYDPSVFEKISLSYKITDIPDSTFVGCTNPKLTTISLPSSILTLGKAAFAGDAQLTSVGVNSNYSAKKLTSIGDSAFFGCKKLLKFYVNTEVASLGKNAFVGCDTLTLGWNTEKVPESFFWTEADGFKQPLQGVTAVVLGTNITTLPKGFMYKNTSLVTITGFGKVATLGDYAFYGCPMVTSKTYLSYTLGSSVKNVGKYALAENKRLHSITLYDNLESVAEGAFSGWDNLVTLTSQVSDPGKVFANMPFGTDSTNAVYKAVLTLSTAGTDTLYAAAKGTKWFSKLITKVWTNQDGGLASAQKGAPYYYRINSSMAGVLSFRNLLLTKDNSMVFPKQKADSTHVAYPYLADITSKADYDQSNWILVAGVKNAANLIDKSITISDGCIAGTVLDKVNCVMQYVPGLTFAAKDGVYTPYDTLRIQGNRAYELNTYVPANFIDQPKYFFVKPQALEYAEIKWAYYGGQGKFYMPSQGTPVDTVADVNPEGLEGGFEAFFGPVPADSFVVGNIYSFKGIVVKTADPDLGTLAGMFAGRAPKKAWGPQSATATGEYVVVPLYLTGVTPNPNPTGVTEVGTAKTVKGVHYYNVAGQVSSTPFEGLNIVVTDYTDGTHSATKVLR